MSTRQHSRKTARRTLVTRNRQPYSLYRRTLRYEPLEDRCLLAVVTVTTLGDTINFGDGVTSLREAIFATNTVPGADTIDFAPSLTAGGPSTILLAQGELAIADTLTIAGPGAGLLTIDAGGNDLTPAVKDGQGSRVFRIDNGTSVVIDVGVSGLLLQGGDVTGDGGAISSSENLTVIDSTINRNSASGRGGGVFSQTGTLLISGSTINSNSARSTSSSSGGGGGIASTGSAMVDHSTLSGNSSSKGGAINAIGNLVVDHSTISGNTAPSFGGGIYSSAGSVTPNSLTIRDSSITNNVVGGEGGGIRKRYGSLLIERTTISGNKALYGGGMSVADGGVDAQIIDSSVTGNNASSFSPFLPNGLGGGILFVGAKAKVIRSTVSGNSTGDLGGGIYSRSGPLTVDSSTISGNSAYKGGGIAGSSGFSPTFSMVVTNSTISGNTATNRVGGIFNLAGLLSVQNSTVTNNSAPVGAVGGVSAQLPGSSSPIEVRSSIIAGNLNGDVQGPSTGTFKSLGYNVVGVGSAVAKFNQPGDQTGVLNPMLGPLTNNGGPTMTHELLPSGPAINAGDPAAIAGVNGVPLNDQRGVPFIRVYGGRIDIGAFEVQPTDYVRGDFNRDDAVDAADYMLYRMQTNLTVPPGTGADANGDGVVNNADYLVWKANYGQPPLQLPQSVASAPAAGLNERMIKLLPEQPAIVAPTSTVDQSSLSIASPQVVPPSSVSYPTLRRDTDEVRTANRSVELSQSENARRFDLAIESWRTPKFGADERPHANSDSRQFSPTDWSDYRPDARRSLESWVDTAFAKI